jgi:hypothetical protein
LGCIVINRYLHMTNYTCLYLLVGYICTDVLDLIIMFSIYIYIYSGKENFKRQTLTPHTFAPVPLSLACRSLLPHLRTAYLHARAAALAAARCSPLSPVWLPAARCFLSIMFVHVRPRPAVSLPCPRAAHAALPAAPCFRRRQARARLLARPCPLAALGSLSRSLPCRVHLPKLRRWELPQPCSGRRPHAWLVHCLLLRHRLCPSAGAPWKPGAAQLAHTGPAPPQLPPPLPVCLCHHRSRATLRMKCAMSIASYPDSVLWQQVRKAC